MKLKGVFAEIRINDEPVEEYRYQGKKIKNQVQCWIPSSRGHNFEIVCGILPKTPRSKLYLACETSLDGVRVDYCLMSFEDSSLERFGVISGLEDGPSSTFSPFCFTERIFKEEAEAEETPEGLNTIKVAVEWRALIGESVEDDSASKQSSLLGPLDEVLFKGVSSMDAIGLGTPQPLTKPINMAKTKSTGSDTLTFIFYYASPETLQARGIMPDPAARSTTETLSTSDPLQPASTKRAASPDRVTPGDEPTSAMEQSASVGHTEIQSKRPRIKSDPESDIHLPLLLTPTTQECREEISRLDKRTEELDVEIRNRPVFSSRLSTDNGSALQDRVLILELSRLANDFQISIKKTQPANTNGVNKSTPRDFIDVDLLDDDDRTIASSSTSQAADTHVKSEAKPDTSLLLPAPSSPESNLQGEVARLERRARELDQEVQKQSTIGQRDGSTNVNAGLLSRMLVLELSRLVHDLKEFAHKLLDTPRES
ncbi:hypothetical protein BDV93DRAFT_520517 [Ceratobasidium sp. AG-I]|nr:hypothetical protein BDV93DRAFT_520517 [Ceratobasidium sp. AG-I]